MRGFLISIIVLSVPIAAEGQMVPRLDPRDGQGDADTTTQPRMSASDSVIFHARTTASRKPYSACIGQAFQTCASGQTVARLSLDGTAYGVLISIFDERHGLERSAFLWRITGRVGIGGTDEEGGGRRGRKGGGGGGGGRGRRGG